MFNFLETSADTATNGNSSLIMWIFIGVLVVAVIAIWFLNNRRYKKQQQEREDQMSSIAVGDKIVTIGLIEGEVVEIGEDTYVLKTGSDECPGYIRIQSGAIYRIMKPESVATEELPEPISAETADPFEEPAENPSSEEAVSETDAENDNPILY